MAADRVLCSKPCSLQNQDKSYTDGTFYVYGSLARFMGKGGSGKLEMEISDIKGQKRSKTNPLLMLETTKKGKPVLKFNSQEDREAISAAITAAADALTQSAAAAVSSGGAAAGGAAAGAGPSSAVISSAAGVRPGQAGAAARAAAAAAQQAQLPPEKKQKLLAENKAVAAQYKALVQDSQTLSDEEFWASAAVQRAAGLTGLPTTTPAASKRGLTNRIVNLARQAKQSVDGQVAELSMTEEDEQQLLAEKPALRQLYDAQVGSVMSRGEFWTRYFKYVIAKQHKRQRAVSRFKQLQQNLTADSAAAVAEMTGQQAGSDQGETDMEALFSALEASSLNPDARKALRRRLNPVLDLASAAEDKMTNDGYGLAHNAARSEAETVQGYLALSSQLAQDYNMHSAVVIGRLPPAAAAAGNRPGQQQAAAAAGAAAAAAAAGSDEMTEEELQQYRQQTGVTLTDLQAAPQQQFEELRVTEPRLYFSAMQQQQQQHSPNHHSSHHGHRHHQHGHHHHNNHQQQQAEQQQQQAAAESLVALIRAVDPANLVDPPVASVTAKQVLHELCGDGSGAAAGRGAPSQLPSELQEHMQQQTMVVDELLRHFWRLIPVNTSEKVKKFNRIQKSMDTCYEALNKLMQQCQPAHKAPVSRLVKPLFDQLDLAGVAAKHVERALNIKGQGRAAAAAGGAAGGQQKQQHKK